MKKKFAKASVKSPEVSVLEEPLPYAFSISDTYNFIDTSRHGITKNFFLRLVDSFNYTIKEIALILNMSERTFHRYEDNSLLSKDASERALHLMRLYKKGTDVFGSSEAFNQWMKTPGLVFNNNAPMAYLDTIFGFEMLEDELGRMEYGIFA